MSKHSRDTLRKRTIRRLFGDEFRFQPVLLEEFRWRVFEQEMSTYGNKVQVVSRSYRNSFNRTLKNFCEEITAHQLRDPIYSLPAGLLARAAVYRLLERGQLNYFPFGQYLRFYFFHERLYYRDSSKRGLWLLTCLVLKNRTNCTKEKATLGAYVSFPYTRKLVFVGSASPTRAMMREMADVHWDIRLIVEGKRSIPFSADAKLGPIDMKHEWGLRNHIILPEGVSIDRREKHRLIVSQEEPI